MPDRTGRPLHRGHHRPPGPQRPERGPARAARQVPAALRRGQRRERGRGRGHDRGDRPRPVRGAGRPDRRATTSGTRRKASPFIETERRLLRPANYPPGNPGRGSVVIETAGGRKLGVVNLQGRVFMEPIDCPFRAADAVVEKLRKETPCILVDLHAEATSEKQALGWYLDGRVSAVVGTHTHVPTADERILPGGTAYITDAGMAGAATRSSASRRSRPSTSSCWPGRCGSSRPRTACSCRRCTSRSIPTRAGPFPSTAKSSTLNSH